MDILYNRQTMSVSCDMLVIWNNYNVTWLNLIGIREWMWWGEVGKGGNI